jgi:hypothetical protein
MTSVGNNLPASATGQALDELYKQGMEQVRKNAAYIFAKGGYTDWALCTWSQKIIPSAIKNNGTAADKARRLGRIPVPHQHKRKRKASIENNGQQQLTLAPAPAQQRLIPAVENSEQLEPPRPAGIPDEVVVAPAAAAAGRPTWSGTGHCAIAGCVWPQLKHSHRCFREGCSFYVHNLCAQASLLDKDNPLNMYCSTTCKEQGEQG